MEERGLGPMEFGVGCMNICLGPDAGLNFSIRRQPASKHRVTKTVEGRFRNRHRPRDSIVPVLDHCTMVISPILNKKRLRGLKNIQYDEDFQGRGIDEASENE